MLKGFGPYKQQSKKQNLPMCINFTKKIYTFFNIWLEQIHFDT